MFNANMLYRVLIHLCFISKSYHTEYFQQEIVAYSVILVG